MVESKFSVSVRGMELKLQSIDSVIKYSVFGDKIAIRVDDQIESGPLSIIRLSGWKITDIKHYRLGTKITIEQKFSE